ncbi:hypothetical protein [Sphingomonas nostoxanthinifaciens]|uniref:hypothetical protein n=1 Tax=Sphingomonas nostoxanthinifaciens TaxID=2872652 RepID=UPI001CC20AC8|nr:hypothetical protein [Sphingomonas nostoxanthinifaciens]UAK26267.1 hypothetical protein K8P63_09325 [Sphingomonas nostoxanthinifaciens]
MAPTGALVSVRQYAPFVSNDPQSSLPASGLRPADGRIMLPIAACAAAFHALDPVAGAGANQSIKRSSDRSRQVTRLTGDEKWSLTIK